MGVAPFIFIGNSDSCLALCELGVLVNLYDNPSKVIAEDRSKPAFTAFVPSGSNSEMFKFRYRDIGVKKGGIGTCHA